VGWLLWEEVVNVITNDALMAELANVLKEHRERLQVNAELRAELAASERARLIAIAVQQELSDELAEARQDASEKERRLEALAEQMRDGPAGVALSNALATAQANELAAARQEIKRIELALNDECASGMQACAELVAARQGIATLQDMVARTGKADGPGIHVSPSQVRLLQEELAALRQDAERMREALKKTLYHLAKLVNGTDDEDPATWEAAKNQVLAARAALQGATASAGATSRPMVYHFQCDHEPCECAAAGGRDRFECAHWRETSRHEVDFSDVKARR
jgi:predicted amino acid-binding ACT domain protein